MFWFFSVFIKSHHLAVSCVSVPCKYQPPETVDVKAVSEKCIYSERAVVQERSKAARDREGAGERGGGTSRGECEDCGSQGRPGLQQREGVLSSRPVRTKYDDYCEGNAEFNVEVTCDFSKSICVDREEGQSHIRMRGE